MVLLHSSFPSLLLAHALIAGAAVGGATQAPKDVCTSGGPGENCERDQTNLLQAQAMRKTALAASAAPAVAVPSVDELPPGWPRVAPSSPKKVDLPTGWRSPWEDHQPDPKVAAKWTYGFYLPIWNSAEPAVLTVLRSVRKFYPDSPVHVLQDGGFYDYGSVCELPEYKCTFEQVPPENSRWNPHSWLLRMHRVAKRLATDYVIYLEPDVLVRGHHRWQPPHDAGGIYDNFNHPLNNDTAAYMQNLGRRVNPCFKLRWRQFGLAGGSYFRTAALLDAFDPAHVAKIDWKGLYEHEGERIFSSDLAMHVALSARGFTVYPWREAAQKFKGWKLPEGSDFEGLANFAQQWPAMNPLAAFEHNHKEGYHVAVPPREQALVNTELKHYSNVDIECRGCVWYSGPMLEEALPVKGGRQPPPAQDDAYKWHTDMRAEVWYPQGPSPEDQCFPAQ